MGGGWAATDVMLSLLSLQSLFLLLLLGPGVVVPLPCLVV